MLLAQGQKVHTVVLGVLQRRLHAARDAGGQQQPHWCNIVVPFLPVVPPLVIVITVAVRLHDAAIRVS